MYKDVTEDLDIKTWLTEQGLGNLVAGTANNSTSQHLLPTKASESVNVTDDQNIHQWLRSQGFGHLINGISEENQHIPYHYPKLQSDDFDNKNFSRTRSHSVAGLHKHDNNHTRFKKSSMYISSRNGSRSRSGSVNYREQYGIPSHLIAKNKYEKELSNINSSSSSSSSSSSNSSSSSSISRSSSSTSGSENSQNDETQIIRIGPKHHDQNDDVIQKQRVFVRYLQPPTPEPHGPIIINETPELTSAPPPIIIRQTHPSPTTPLPIVYREQAPPLAKPHPTTIIKKHVTRKPPRQIIIENIPPPPQKHPDIIIEKWLPAKRHKRREVIIHQCKSKQNPAFTMINPCNKSNIQYVKKSCNYQYPEYQTNQPVLNCVPYSDCPSSIMFAQHPGQSRFCTPANQQNMYYPPTLNALPVPPTQHTQFGSEYVPSQQEMISQIWKALQVKKPLGQSGNVSNIGAGYIPNQQDAVRNTWNALQSQQKLGTAMNLGNLGSLGREYVPSENQSVQQTWTALGGLQKPGTAMNLGNLGSLGREYVPSENQSVQQIWNALGSQHKPGTATNLANLGSLGREYVPSENQSVQQTWNALGGIHRQAPNVASFPNTMPSQIGTQYIPNDNQAIQQAWTTVNQSSNMPFTGLLESFVKRRFTGVH